MTMEPAMTREDAQAKGKTIVAELKGMGLPATDSKDFDFGHVIGILFMVDAATNHRRALRMPAAEATSEAFAEAYRAWASVAA